MQFTCNKLCLFCRFFSFKRPVCLEFILRFSLHILFWFGCQYQCKFVSLKDYTPKCPDHVSSGTKLCSLSLLTSTKSRHMLAAVATGLAASTVIKYTSLVNINRHKNAKSDEKFLKILFPDVYMYTVVI